MTRRYPRFGRAYVIQQKRDKPECAACGQEASHMVVTQVSWFRGEDESDPACPRHKKMAEENIGKFCAHIATKAKFLAAKEG